MVANVLFDSFLLINEKDLSPFRFVDASFRSFNPKLEFLVNSLRNEEVGWEDGSKMAGFRFGASHQGFSST